MPLATICQRAEKRVAHGSVIKVGAYHIATLAHNCGQLARSFSSYLKGHRQDNGATQQKRKCGKNDATPLVVNGRYTPATPP